jgi:coproporphyrinogen III oxidase
MITKETIAAELQALQSRICNAIESADGYGKFAVEEWSREGGGGGITRILQNGNVLEKAGVNFSAVHGELPQNIMNALNVSSSQFFACGVSIVMHPVSPMVPIIHMNVRYFELGDGQWWFGGGIDLTPHYVNESDAKFFHQELKQVCDRYDSGFYPKFKKWADDYFFIKHRNETRGIGGIFFDRLNESSAHDKQTLFAFLLDVGNTFAPVYSELILRNRELHFGENEKQWQLLRRGRYVEFNLVYDKGTKFGLDTNGRIESILMSLPETAGWKYDFKPELGSKEEQTLKLLKKDINWVI